VEHKTSNILSTRVRSIGTCVSLTQLKKRKALTFGAEPKPSSVAICETVASESHLRYRVSTEPDEQQDSFANLCWTLGFRQKRRHLRQLLCTCHPQAQDRSGWEGGRAGDDISDGTECKDSARTCALVRAGTRRVARSAGALARGAGVRGEFGTKPQRGGFAVGSASTSPPGHRGIWLTDERSAGWLRGDIPLA
jgi:hypothetical protein